MIYFLPYPGESAIKKAVSSPRDADWRGALVQLFQAAGWNFYLLLCLSGLSEESRGCGDLRERVVTPLGVLFLGLIRFTWEGLEGGWSLRAMG